MHVRLPRLVVAGLSGDSGKTTVSLSILTALLERGLTASVFKKGPDFIDSAWLGAVGKATCRNLDTYMVDPAKVLERFVSSAIGSDIAIVEGNRGLFDGKDLSGTHSTSELAKLLQAPILLVVNTTKMTRTVAAIINGLVSFDPGVRIAGVILNRVAGERHRKILTESIGEFCRIPVLGALPRLGDDSSVIPGRHLGLVTPAEFSDGDSLHTKLAEIAAKYIDIDGIIELTSKADDMESQDDAKQSVSAGVARIGYFNDSVFTFYYPENLEALESSGAELVGVSSLDDTALPDIDALYIGGGFPETHAERLCSNKSMMVSVRDAVNLGLPVYAECGGLIYLSRSLTWHGKKFEMAGVFPVDLEMQAKPVGHGYARCRVDRENPFLEIGTLMKGHEFHYSGALSGIGEVDTCLSMQRGVGLGGNRDGLICKSTFACYTHIHADGVPSWSRSVVDAACRYRTDRNAVGTRQLGGSSG
ncbi:MAG: cobyrinate a,c-diamide synthase [Candidatus Zixiibacteriota bacterium]